MVGPFARNFLRRNVANFITLGRIPLCLLSFTFAVLVLRGSPHEALYGFIGELLLIVTALTDYFDGLVARRYNVITKLGPLADQMLDKMVYCIIFPTISVGMMAVDGQKNIYHVILALVLCVTLLVRDHYVSFLRVVADRHQADTSVHQIGKLRTLLALPTACALYAYGFCRGNPEDFFYFNSLFVWVRSVDVTYPIVLELSLCVINVVSAISYTRTYGSYLMKELCEDDEDLRRGILSIFPNALTCMNAIMGIVAMGLAGNGRFHLAFVMLMAAAVFDKLDGAAARKLGLVEEDSGEKRITLGAVLDDVADAVSFCLAPAAIAASYVGAHAYAWLLIGYFLAGIARLTFFTLDQHPISGFFKGLPCPAAALLTGGAVQAAHQLDPGGHHYGSWVIGVFLAASLLMNAYFIPYVHFGKLMSRSRLLTRVVFATMLGIMFSNYLGVYILVIMSCYLFSPLFVKAPRPLV